MILRSGESQLEARDVALSLKALWDEEFQGPFPYDDCRWLKREFDGDLDDLIPDLDLWVIDVIGFASRGTRVLEFSHEQALQVHGRASLKFFEQHPEYAWSERHINEANTPDLYAYLDVSNKLRLMLLSLLDLMLREQFIEESS